MRVWIFDSSPNQYCRALGQAGPVKASLPGSPSRLNPVSRRNPTKPCHKVMFWQGCSPSRTMWSVVGFVVVALLRPGLAEVQHVTLTFQVIIGLLRPIKNMSLFSMSTGPGYQWYHQLLPPRTPCPPRQDCGYLWELPCYPPPRSGHRRHLSLPCVLYLPHRKQSDHHHCWFVAHTSPDKL